MRRTKRALIVLALASSASGLLAAADTVLLEGTADAETVEARNAADVFATPGEQARVVTRVRAGKEMTVLQTKNRWLKVRVNGRTGWITRSNVTTVELSEPAPRAKRRRPFVEGRSTRRGSRGKGPSDRIGADVTGDDEVEADDDDDDARHKRERKRARIKRKKAQAREMDNEVLDEDDEEALASGEEADDDDGAKADDDDDGDDDEDKEEDEEKEPEREYVVVKVASAKIYEEASTESETLDSASEGSKLFVVERDGKWIKIEDENGNEGWVKASKVEDGGDSGSGYKWEKFAKRARANLGYASLTQNFTSNGTTDPSYKLSSAAAVLAVGGDVLYDYSPTYLIGGDIGYRLQIASPGIRYSDGENSVNIGYKVHQIDLGVRGGYKLSKKSGMAAYGRLGYHYERFGINNVSDFEKNLAYLPSEILQGPTIGGIFEMPKLTEKFALRAGFDYLKFLASRKQTVNLEDGSTSSPSALWLNLGTVYDWKADWKITGDYQFTYAKTDWSGTVEGSMRPQQATSASRKDSLHLLMIGLGRTF
jgi:SH3-like domain-containing protein